MRSKSTRHETWTLKELERIAQDSSLWAGEKITVDAAIRLAVYNLIIEHAKHPIQITKEYVKDIGFKARKACQ